MSKADTKTATTVRTYTDADYRAMMPGTPYETAKTLRAFHGDPAVKRKYLQRVRIHAKADEIIHGTYWEDGKGCAVGCTIHSSDHSAYERELGIPRVLAKLEDGIFEGMSNGESKTWPERFLKAAKTGADLRMIWPQFAVWMLTDAKWGTIQYCRTDSQRKATQDVADAYQSIVDGLATMVNWFKLRDAAAYDAADAAYDAADAAAAYAATAAAAYDAAYDAADAAYNAAYDARTKVRIAQSLKLIELLEAA